MKEIGKKTNITFKNQKKNEPFKIKDKTDLREIKENMR